MADFKIEKVGEGVSNIGKSLKKKPLIAGIVAVVIVGALAIAFKNRNSSSSTATNTPAVYDDKIAADNGVPGTEVSSQIATFQQQMYSAVTQAIAQSQDETLSSVTDLIAKQKSEYDAQLEYTNSSLEKYGTATSDALQKITDSVRTNADLTSSKFNTLDQKISSIPIYSQAASQQTSTAPSINYGTQNTSTPSQVTTQSTAKDTYAGIYQNGAYVGNNGQGYNETVSNAFESSLKTNKDAYNKEIARVNEVIQNRTAQGLDTSKQYDYLDKIKQ